MGVVNPLEKHCTIIFFCCLFLGGGLVGEGGSQTEVDGGLFIGGMIGS